jgi:uncharacterized protein YjiS (DUF1127 family)
MMTVLSLHRSSAVAFLSSRPVSGLQGLRRAFTRFWRRRVARHPPARFDAQMLKDLNISRAQANFELERPLWF